MFKTYPCFAVLSLSLPLFASACAPSRAQGRLGPLVASSNLRQAATVHAGGRQVQRQIIHSASLELEDKNVGKIARRAAQVIRRFGGQVAHSRTTATRARLRLRVPAPRLTALLQLKRLAEVASVQLNGEDVTTAVLDLELRLDTALKARKRYLELLSRANSVTEALPVQKELSKVVAEIEQLKAQITRVRERVRMATIDVSIKRPVRPGVVGWVFYGVYRGVKWLFIWD